MNETYGPTTGLWASLLWVCPAIVWKMPTITFTRTSKWSTKVKEKAIQPVISSWANSPPDVGSLKLDRLGISISICASFKGEANGINIAMVGPSIERGGNKVDLIAFCFTTEGFELVT